MAKNASGRKYLRDRISTEQSIIKLSQRDLAELGVAEAKPAPEKITKTAQKKVVVSEEVQLKVKQAEMLGKQAFERGDKAVPANDGNLMALLQGMKPSKDTQTILKSWADAWQKANLAKPVEGVTEKDLVKSKAIVEEGLKIFRPKEKPEAKLTGVEKLAAEDTEAVYKQVVDAFGEKSLTDLTAKQLGTALAGMKSKYLQTKR